MRPDSTQDNSAVDRRNDGPCRRILSAESLYGVLGVSRDADDAAIKAEFRRRAREVHPDKNTSPLAGEAFKRLQRAQEVLSDPKARRQYNVTGHDGPTPKPASHHAYYHYQPGCAHYGVSFTPLQLIHLAMVPVLLSMLISIALVSTPGFLDKVQRTWPYTQSKQRSGARQEPLDKLDAVHLTHRNADEVCGDSRQMCVVLLTQATKGYTSREQALIKDVRAVVADKIRTARGQSLKLTWTTAPAVGKWSSLLPANVKLPWVVVLKKSSVGLRAVALPVPPTGAKTKNRLRNGVPQLLEDIVAGSVKFEPVKGTVSELFQR